MQLDRDPIAVLEKVIREGRPFVFIGEIGSSGDDKHITVQGSAPREWLEPVLESILAGIKDDPTNSMEHAQKLITVENVPAHRQ